MSPDVSELRSKVEEMSAEVTDHRDELDKLSAQHDKAAESLEQLQSDVAKIQSEVSDFLTPSLPADPNCCCSKGSAPYWSNPPFLFFLTFGRSGAHF